jgi:hypothetical protein
MQVLSQLSYGPVVASKCSREVELVGPVDPAPLVVPARRNAQSDNGMTINSFDRKKEAPLEVAAIDSDCVDLGGRVWPSLEPICGSPRAVAINDDYVALGRAPFAWTRKSSGLRSKIMS